MHAIALVIVASLVTPPSSATLEGHVYFDGMPLPGVTVRAASPCLGRPRLTVTAIDGTYAFDDVPSQCRYTVAADLVGLRMTAKPQPRTLRPDDDVVIDIDMEAAPQRGPFGRADECFSWRCAPPDEPAAFWAPGQHRLAMPRGLGGSELAPAVVDGRLP